MCVFTRTLSDDLASLVKQIDKKVADNKAAKMQAFVVLISEDPDADEKKLEELAKKHDIKIPLTLFDGIAGPPGYKMSKDAEISVMHWKGRVVKANNTFAKNKLDKAGVDATVKDTATILE